MAERPRTIVTGMSAVPVEAAVWEALRTVSDPEVGENVIDLGLI